MIRRSLLVIALVALLPSVAPLVPGGDGGLQGQLPPDEEWRTLTTPHFRVHHPRGLEVLAGRAAHRAERAHQLLSRLFVEPPSGMIDLVVTDHMDLSNGFAGVVPWRRITVYAVPPVDASGLSYFDDWMELVVTHELVHIFHLEYAGRLGRGLRGVFGRVPAQWPFFPNRGLPRWVVEGIAVYYESSLTDSGRIRGTYHDMVLRTAILHGTFESIDQLSGESPVWPAGGRPYIYGSLFFAHLVERHGPESMGAFVRAVGRQWIPFRVDAAARDAFGVSFTQAYREWEEELTQRYRELADSLEAARPVTRGEPLTHEARTAIHPAFSPDGGTLAFARADGRSDPQLRFRGSARGWGGVDAQEWGVRTNGLSSFSWAPDGRLLVSQFETEGPYRVRRDLVWMDAEGGEGERITRGARLSFPHIHPGGEVAVAVQEGEGTNRLVRVDLLRDQVDPLGPFDPETHWGYPRWSPDGEWIAASRWRPGGRFDLVLLRPDGEVAWEVTGDRAVDVTPAWSPDGRWLLWGSDRTGIPNLFAVPVEPESGRPGAPRQVTHLLEGAGHPEVDPTGSWVVYARYGPTGWDLERVPFRPADWPEPLPTDPRFLQGGEGARERYAALEGEPRGRYRALPSLAPRHWEPLYRESTRRLGVQVLAPWYGVYTEGRDLVGRHNFQAWLRGAPADGRWEGRAGYGWAGLGNPVLGVSGEEEWRSAGVVAGQREDGTVDTLFVVARDRSAGAAMTLARARARSYTALTLGGRAIREERLLQEREGEVSARYRLDRGERTLGEGRATLTFSTARGHAFSVGPEAGVSGFVQSRLRRDLNVPDTLSGVTGLDRGFREATGVVRLYRGLGGAGYANHVAALRLSGGAAAGPGAGAFHFELGGNPGRSESLTSLGLFGGSPLLFPVRGYPEGARTGRNAWSGTAEYRFPLRIVHRGWRAWPVHLDRLSGALFADAGDAWGLPPGAREEEGGGFDPLASVGAELLLQSRVLWGGALDLRLGTAVPQVEGDGPAVALRLGRSF